MSSSPSLPCLVEWCLYSPRKESAMNSVTYGCEQRQANVLQETLSQQMEAQSEMCDVTLNIGGFVQKAHWCVLVICPYFQSLYKSDMKEKLAGVITLDFGSPSAVRSAIRFLYKGTVDVSEQNIRELLQISDYLQIEGLKAHCSKYLQYGLITVKNCVGLCILGTLYNLEYLYNRSFKFLCAHLPEVLEKDEIMTLTNDSIVYLIANENLRYVSVEKFFQFLVKWVQHDPKQREEHFPELFCGLNLARVTQNFLKYHIEGNDLVEKSEKCRAHVSEHKEQLKAGVEFQETAEKEVIIVTGGMRRDNVYGTDIMESVYAYIPVEKRWIELPPLPRRVSKPLVTSDGKEALYVIDGSYRFDRRQYVFKFLPATKEWREMRVTLPASLADPCLELVACARGKVYVLVSSYTTDAGARKWCCYLMQLNEVKRELELKCWLFFRGMNSQFKCCTVACRYVCITAWKLNDKLGRSSKHNWAKFVYFDAEKETLCDRSRGALFQQVMYSRGNEVIIAKPGKLDAKVFNVNARKWRQKKELSLPLMCEEPDRTDFCYVCVGNHLYVFGGRSHTTKLPISSALQFDIDKKVCTSIESLPSSISSAGCCVMTLPADLVRCHLDCPHCEMPGRRQLARYHRDFPNYSDEEEDEDDFDYVYDDDDDDGYDNDWDEDLEFDHSSFDEDFGPYLY